MSRDPEKERALSRPEVAIGLRVRYLREALGHTVQKEFAALCGMSQGALSDLEKGRSVDSDFLEVMAEKLGARVAWLRTGKGDVMLTEPGASSVVPVAATAPDVPWPFPNLSRARIERRSKWEIHFLESLLLEALTEMEQDRRRG
jgi:transcriptional regulator with XRE-family HTH domain